MPVEATRLIRKMRGGAQSHLLAAEDGCFYITKFRGNPQGRRVLVNEWIAGAILDFLQIQAPHISVVNLSPAFLQSNPEIHYQLGSGRRPVESGFQFGSRFPGDPNVTAVYDYLPDSLLASVVNLRDFLGVLAFDRWLGNSDARQAIFLRARIRQFRPDDPVPPQQKGFLAFMIDHGYVFEGPHWEFCDSPNQSLYSRPLVYQDVRGFADFEPWLERIRHFPASVLDEALRSLPSAWLDDGDSARLEVLLDRLMRRRDRVGDLIRVLSSGRYDPFPNWREGPVAVRAAP